MKKILLATTALLAMGATSFAADLPARVYTKAPVLVAPGVNWSGFYAGVFGGYGWSQDIKVDGLAIATDEINGGFGGGTVGYNWQAPGSQWVFGIEVDAAGSSLKYTTVGFEDKIDAFGSVTGRVGYAVDAALFYAKGGFAWADNKVTVPGFSESKLHTGWTVGGGLEYMFAPAWSVKGEYMYADYGKETYGNIVDIGATVHTVKAGVNYHFGAPVVAKY
jgi:outer membrane immunogenic protein|uniref:Putative outer-membrane immunogenic protein n=1 Tax=Rhodopseudomonas palustris (strain BisA53) TaxID=316055 RepID=Q07M99_RHOP5